MSIRWWPSGPLPVVNALDEACQDISREQHAQVSTKRQQVAATRSQSQLASLLLLLPPPPKPAPPSPSPILARPAATLPGPSRPSASHPWKSSPACRPKPLAKNDAPQAEEHFRALDQDQGREHYDRDMFNCELALNILGIGTLFSCRGHLDGLAAFPYITVIPQRALAGLVPRYVSMMETMPLSQKALAMKNTRVHAMSELGQHLLSLRAGFYEGRKTPLPCHLVIQSNGLGSYTLANQGAVAGLLSDQETLKAYQDEFMAFGEYLKSIWE